MRYKAVEEAVKMASKDLEWHRGVLHKYFQDKWNEKALDEKITIRKRELKLAKERVAFLEKDLEMLTSI